MTRVDFYVLDDNGEQAREQFACRLVEKAVRLRHRVFVHTPSPGDAQQLDRLLWTFSDGSFVPHVLDAADLEPALAEATPVRVGSGAEPAAEAELLVNLDAGVPAFFSRFDRVAEIVAGDETRRGQARERFRFYRDRGYEIETHQLAGRAR
jgi:DNA polymerase-3 subunit chi